MFKYSTYSAFGQACYKSLRLGTESHLNNIQKKLLKFLMK